jgi:L-lactate dehydrogenase complex protein LldG
MTAGRDEILRRVRAATNAAAPARPVAYGYRRHGTLDEEQRVALFCERVGEYRAELHRGGETDLPALVASICAARGARRLVVPPRLPAAWRSESLELVADDGLSAQELDAIDGALTGCTVAIAETGTIVLTAGPTEGRRALTLVPDLHLCVVGESQIVELVPEALARIQEAGLAARPITFVSGPSATSDIELSRVEGVHGPRDLAVLVVKEGS